jgi:hypothetical protein
LSHVIEIILEGLKFEFRHIVDMTMGRGSPIQKVNLMVVGAMRWDFFGDVFREDVGVLVIMSRDVLVKKVLFRIRWNGIGWNRGSSRSLEI